MAYDTWKALNELFDGNVIEYARDLGLSTKTLYRWQEPTTDFTDSGAYNPLDRLITMSATALRLGKSRKHALTLLRCHADNLHQATVDIQPTMRSPKEIMAELSSLIKEFSTVTAATSTALSDGRISRLDSYNIQRASWELIHAVVGFSKVVHASVKA